MSNKLQKVLSEIDKVKEKIAVQQTRLRELEQQKTELENMEIVGMVRGLDVAPEELAAFIKAFRGSKHLLLLWLEPAKVRQMAS